MQEEKLEKVKNMFNVVQVDQKVQARVNAFSAFAVSFLLKQIYERVKPQMQNLQE